MGDSVLKFDIPHPQFSSPNGKKLITLKLDHLTDTGGGCDLKQLYSTSLQDAQPGEQISLFIKNEVSTKEQELFKFCKDQMKKKNFDSIVVRASELLKEHPSSAWAHFFFGVACKKIPDKEKFFVPAITHAVTVNPNFLSGWQALHKHFLTLGGFFSREAHDETCIIVKVLLKLDPSYDNWCVLVGQIWDYAMSNNFSDNRILTLMSPYLSCSCPKRKTVAASFFVNFVRAKKKLLPKTFSSEVLSSFQILITGKESQMYRLGLLHAAIRYFNRTNDPKQICSLLNFIHVHNVLKWDFKSAKEFAYNLIYEIFKSLGEDALETVLILKNACGEGILNNHCYFLCDTVFKLTSSYSSLLENYNSRQGALQNWGRLLYVKVLTDLKLYQEAYEQILGDLNCGVSSHAVEKSYMEMLIDILSHAKDPSLQKFTLKLGYKYLKMYGLSVKVLHCLCLVNISLQDFVTARRILQCLMSLGAIDDALYLLSLVEDDCDVKLDYLKALNNVPNAHLLSAVIYKDLGKSKRVLKSMLEASFHFHGGIIPFEWLGIHYHERDLVVKSTRYFLEAFSNYLVSCVSVNYIISIYSKHGDVGKTRAFFETLDTRSAITTDVACTANLKSGLNYLTKARESLDFHRALEKFRKVTDFFFERKTIEMVADSLSYFGMHGSASDFYLMCHAEKDMFHVYPSVLYASETKMVKGKGHRYLTVARNVATKARKSPLALFTHACAVFDRAVASYSVNNFRHCVFLCQQAILLLSRCIALNTHIGTFWISIGNVLFAVSSMHSDFSTVYVPSWLICQNRSKRMVPIKKHEAFVLALRCYSIAMKTTESEEIKLLISFYIGLMFRYAKTFYKELGDRMLYWALDSALASCDSQNWQRNNLCGVILTGLGEYREALEFFLDAMLIGAREDARDAEFNLGIVHLRLGEFTDAHEVFMHRRGGDPSDSLVWRSYILLHQCLGDKDTVLHYLWYLIYSIKHYPSFDQGMEYLKMICDSLPLSVADSAELLKKKCLLYDILQNPLFIKMSFVGDCEVPHKFNDVTAQNYFHHGQYYSALGKHSTAEENFHEFLKLVAVSRNLNQYVNDALLQLAMSSENLSHRLHDLVTANHPTAEHAVLKFLTLWCTNQSQAASQLLSDLDQLSGDCDDVFASLFEFFGQTDALKLPLNTRKLYSAFYVRTLLRQLLGIPSAWKGVSHKEIVSDLVNDVFTLTGPDESTSGFFSKKTIAHLLDSELKKC